MKARGVIHVHSKYSPDASHSIEELKGFFLAHGYNFIGLTDHVNNEVDGEYIHLHYQNLVRECIGLSAADFCVIPGLEIGTAEGFHILGLGLSRPVMPDRMSNVIDEIRKQGALAILAHPYRENFKKYDEDFFSRLNGIEIWNRGEIFANYPNTRAVRAVKKLRENLLPVYAYLSLDFHSTKDFAAGAIEIEINSLEQQEILSELRNGSFVLKMDNVRINSNGEISGFFKLQSVINNIIFYGLRNNLKMLQVYLEHFGIRIPGFFRNIANRMFFRKRR